MYKTALLLVSLPLLAGEPKPAPTAQASNRSVAIAATLYLGKDAVREQLGSDLGGSFILVKVELTPKGDQPLVVDRDAFLLRSYKDGQKCQPFAPTQIAGSASLVVTPTGTSQIGADRGGFGGLGLPIPGSAGPSIGNSSTPDGTVQAKLENAKKEDPVLAALKAKVLEEKKTTAPVSGLLYFSLDGKHKPKDLVLQYKTKAGQIELTFK